MVGSPQVLWSKCILIWSSARGCPAASTPMKEKMKCSFCAPPRTPCRRCPGRRTAPAPAAVHRQRVQLGVVGQLVGRASAPWRHAQPGGAAHAQHLVVAGLEEDDRPAAAGRAARPRRPRPPSRCRPSRVRSTRYFLPFSGGAERPGRRRPRPSARRTPCGSSRRRRSSRRRAGALSASSVTRTTQLSMSASSRSMAFMRGWAGYQAV